MSSDRDKSSAEIEREVESTRAGLTATLDELKDRLSPGHLFDQVLDFSKDSGGSEFMSSIGSAVRANPIPVLLIGAGIAWLLTSGGGARQRYIEDDETGETPAQARRRARSRRQPDWADEDPEFAELESAARRGRRGRFARAEDTTEGAFHAAVDGAEDAAGGIASRAREFGSRAERAGAEAWDSATEAGSRLGGEAAGVAARTATAVGSAAANLAGQAASVVGQAAASAYDTVTGAAGQAASTVGQAAYSAGRSAGDAAYTFGRSAGGEVYSYGRTAAERAIDSVEDAWRNGQRNIGGIIEQQPLVAGAIGLAIGAALGAAIPSTNAENRLMGDHADELKRRARELATEQYANVKETAGQLYEDVRDEAATLSAVPGEIAGQVAERVVAAATSAGNAAKESVDEALGGSGSEKKPPMGGPSKATPPSAGKMGTAKAS